MGSAESKGAHDHVRSGSDQRQRQGASVALGSIVFAQVGAVWACRSDHRLGGPRRPPNRLLWAGVGLELLAFLLFQGWPPLATALQLAPIPSEFWWWLLWFIPALWLVDAAYKRTSPSLWRRLMEQRQIRWRDRQQAGEELAKRLLRWRADPQGIVVGLPRGGVVVALEVAIALDLPLVSWAVRKLAHPRNPELAVGAIAPGGVLIWDEPYLRQLHLEPQLRRSIVLQADRELYRRQHLYGDPPLASFRDRHLLVVDDGVATGMTVQAALQSLRQGQPEQIIFAVPVIDRTVAARLRPQMDGLVALAQVDHLRAVGDWYQHFEAVDDRHVQAVMTACSSDSASSEAGIHRRGKADLV